MKTSFPLLPPLPTRLGIGTGSSLRIVYFRIFCRLLRTRMPRTIPTTMTSRVPTTAAIMDVTGLQTGAKVKIFHTSQPLHLLMLLPGPPFLHGITFQDSPWNRWHSWVLTPHHRPPSPLPCLAKTWHTADL